mgnify:CR=1 FL=1
MYNFLSSPLSQFHENQKNRFPSPVSEKWGTRGQLEDIRCRYLNIAPLENESAVLLQDAETF